MPIPLRPDFDAGRVHRAARAGKDANQVRRLLALAAIYDGTSCTQVLEIYRRPAALRSRPKTDAVPSNSWVFQTVIWVG